MRFVDFAIDLAAVLNASRSVAAKHIALRSRQLDAYSRTSSVATSLRRQAAQSPREDPENEYGAREDQNEPSAGGVAPVERHAPPAEAADSTDAAPLRSQPKKSAESRYQGASTIPKANPLNGAAPAFASAVAQKQQQQSVPSSSPAQDELDVPPGIDVNVFHTSRGSKILDSVRDSKMNDPSGGRSQPGGPAKEHPMRNWPLSPPPAPLQTRAPAGQAASDTKVAEEKIPGTKTEAVDTTAQASTISAAPTSNKTGQEAAEPAKVATGNPIAAPTPRHALRESTVPASRLSRMWNYGGLAAGMLGGAMTETFSRALGGGGQGSVLLSGKNMERLVAKLSRMRGAALKMGQMMSFQDTKMLPAPIQEVLQRVQDRADYMPAWQRDRVLAANLGPDWRELFTEFEETPIAAASIGQVHRAVLKANGKRVAVKIQFPGVADSIDSDLDNLGILLTATKLLPKGLYLNKTIDNARLELGWECDYEREAKCAQRYKELLQAEQDVFAVPGVYPEASGKHVITMDFMHGVGVTRVKSFTQEQRDWIGTQILRLCLREITEFHFMQTDPNWTNFLYNADTNRLELLDFGASREYPDAFVSQYVRLLEAASRSDHEGVRQLSEGLGYLTGHESKIMIEAHVQSVLTLAEPFLGSAPEVYDFEDQTITERVKGLIPVMLRERLAPPPEETYSLHRKLSGAFLLCARLGSRVRCRDLFQDALVKTGYLEAP